MSGYLKAFNFFTKMQDTGANGTCYCHGDDGHQSCGCRVSIDTKREELRNSSSARCKNCGHYISQHFD